MRIVHVSPYFNFPSEGSVGGVLLYVYELSKALVKEGYEVSVYTSGNVLKSNCVRVAEKSFERKEGIEVHRFPSIDNLSLRFFFPKLENPIPFLSFLSSLSKEHDVIHVHGHEYVTSFIASVMAKKCRTPIVLSIHSTGEALEEFYAVHLFRKVLDRTAFSFSVNSADIVIAPTKQALTVLKKFRPKRIMQIPLGIDLERFDNVRGSSNYILFLGRLEQTKRPEDFIKAIPLILEKVDIEFVVAGSGIQYTHLQNLARELEISKHVKFLGWVPYEKVPAIIANASVVVAPGNAGYSIMEAAAARKPIVSANLDWNVSAIGRESALFIERGNIKSLAEAILKVLTNQKFAETLADRARKYIEKNASWDVITNRIVKAYEEALKHH
ncbi:glycosyltransferase family 4 protein [Candidatus Bathyarchaeota archaeon]|nr:glycosyltransferase family 4 protein [Candidatus Bathyarchaeota archaeon]